ncbi:hypothetical protein CYY_002478 [Polysphondylium violaceum]|uniref:Transmembrane protein n=1 Tax=Polysphondylium violaceum TaxID=133409 RepID=A0A8J4Q060_9MYCE|nr:hypothetical protein CYY_002478 [Polysphondylium violaceum]
MEEIDNNDNIVEQQQKDENEFQLDRFTDIYLRFEAFLYLLMGLGGLVFPSTMIGVFNQYESTDPYKEMFNSLCTMYTLFLSIVSLYQSISVFFILSSKTKDKAHTLITMNLLLSSFLIVFNYWIFKKNSQLYTEDGLYNFFISFALSVADFIILFSLTKLKSVLGFFRLIKKETIKYKKSKMNNNNNNNNNNSNNSAGNRKKPTKKFK